ncbi:MAG: class I SAM-dependent methyltransferase [Deltaproteobacteria bacterium]|nr:class I SAM-dependent methyltransferase [Deltaproteobacteria bacterium]
MLPGIPPQILEPYRPISFRESFYLRARWRLCPYGLIDSLLPDSGNILDFGCGYGLLSNYLISSAPFRTVTGIDINGNRIRTAKRSVKDRKNISFHCTSIDRLETARYDSVVMTDVLHHINDANLNLLLEILSSSLKNKGTLVILDVDRKPFLKFCITYLIDTVLNPSDRLYYRSAKGLQDIFNKYPFIQRKLFRADRGLPLSDIIFLLERIF